MSRIHRLLTAGALALLPLGCGGSLREEKIEVKASNDPLFLPRSILQQYANGQPMSSEVTSFPSMVESVRKVDPTRADLLEKGLRDLQAAPESERSAMAKELLKTLQPSMK